MTPGKDQQADTLRRTVFNYSYVVLTILLLITTGLTILYYQNSHLFADEGGTRWTAVVFLLGFCVSLLIFGMTYREATARIRLEQKTADLIKLQKQIETLLNAEHTLRIAAEQSSRAKDEFLAVVSHELRTPLNAIAGWARILRMPSIGDEVRESALDKIDRNLRIQTELVEEILNFSDIMSREVAVERKPMKMRDIFEAAVSTVSVSAFQKAIALVNDDRLDGEVVLGDGERLKIALVNVLANAVKFTPSGGRIEAHAFSRPGEVKCVISDNGFGIPPDFIPRVFQPYEQSEEPATRQHGGLGLGLTIAHQIVRLHDGSINVESPGSGYGATFTITLPTTQVH